MAPHSSILVWKILWIEGDAGWIPGLGRSPGIRNGTTLQYTCLKNPMDWGVWQATYSSCGHKRVRHNLATKQQQARP